MLLHVRNPRTPLVPPLLLATALLSAGCREPITRVDVQGPGVEARLTADLEPGVEYAFLETFDYESTVGDGPRRCYRWTISIEQPGAPVRQLRCNPFLDPTLETASHRAAENSRTVDCVFRADRPGRATMTVKLAEQASCTSSTEVSFAAPPTFRRLSLALAK